MMLEKPKLDCRTQVITPENIQFEYALAGPFQRLPAFLFDVVVRTSVYVGITFVASMVLAFVPFGTTLVTIWMLIGYFVLSWFYGALFETWFNGRTVGKMVFKLRAISTDGRPINGSQAALRNLLRLADMNVLLSLELFDPEAPPVYVIPTMSVGLLAMMLSQRAQRLGDLVAGTMVISEARKVAPWNIKPDDNRAFGLAELIPANFQPSVSLAQTIGLYMENRTRLNPLRRNDIAKHLARPLIEKFGLLPDTGYDLLLCALYVRIYMSDDQQTEGKTRMRMERQVAASPQTTVMQAASSVRVTPPPQTDSLARQQATSGMGSTPRPPAQPASQGDVIEAEISPQPSRPSSTPPSQYPRN